jgi:outer membrane protein assembly factor BamE (lipoprotein component of BamABCDE complex)
MVRLTEKMKIALRPTFVALMLALAGTACTPTVEMRGNLPHPDVLSQLQPGKTSRDDVLALLGTPSSTIAYGDETWHYISAKSEQVAFFAPKFVERRVVSVAFDPRGMVKTVSNRELGDGQTIELVERETPTAGKEMSILQQLLGNVGRFSKDAAPK